mmetsp:Transcript_17408/g.25428  ORF Transcript_17408/g.25428 Transcript_17408/m.25428 type:complete len:221 (-) Transcript_17408:244-906(-)|eukprot:CAMPEP_0113945000 /NCGR_PEP_ID=MMETSP1339-20121228/38425_1 /TAXON_ID=94617 /ORGANISM="Fibrocapsa japonica" /LENGTH=220 /DNA_ID=CAMNT_0000950385 /DNA_START=180 /DNA_END=842 /DNA_ORIENTATION=- /assembly_acc=CAM_ASM_000762
MGSSKVIGAFSLAISFICLIFLAASMGSNMFAVKLDMCGYVELTLLFKFSEMCSKNKNNPESNDCNDYDSKDFEEGSNSLGNDEHSAFEGAMAMICVAFVMLFILCIIFALNLKQKISLTVFHISGILLMALVWCLSFGAFGDIAEHHLYNPNAYVKAFAGDNEAFQKCMSVKRTMGAGMALWVVSGTFSLISFLVLIVSAFVTQKGGQKQAIGVVPQQV